MASSSPTPFKYANINIVTLFVGESKTAFRIHEDLLFEHSTVFKAAFSPGFPEASTREMTLPDEEPYSFEFLIRCLYLHPADPNDILKYYEDISKLYIGLEIEQLIKLYILANKYDVERLMIAVAIAVRKHKATTSFSHVAMAYENLPKFSAFRKDLLRSYAVDFQRLSKEQFDNEGLKEKLVGMPEVAADLLREVGMKGD